MNIIMIIIVVAFVANIDQDVKENITKALMMRHAVSMPILPIDHACYMEIVHKQTTELSLSKRRSKQNANY